MSLVQAELKRDSLNSYWIVHFSSFELVVILSRLKFPSVEFAAKDFKHKI